MQALLPVQGMAKPNITRSWETSGFLRKGGFAWKRVRATKDSLLLKLKAGFHLDNWDR